MQRIICGRKKKLHPQNINFALNSELKSNLKVETDPASGGPIRRQSSKSDKTQCELVEDEFEMKEVAGISYMFGLKFLQNPT